MIQQLPLAVQLNDDATFADFCWNRNRLLQDALLRTFEGECERFFYIWGAIGSGKSHVLQACCQRMSALNRSVTYLPLNLLKEWGPQVLEGIHEHDLVAIDDIEAVVGDPIWEEALFHLYNRMRDQNQNILVMTAKMPPLYSEVKLPDLRSRLAWGLVLQLNDLDDMDKVSVLKLRAKKRGFHLSTQVCQYMMNHCARNMHDLFDLLNRLDQASLAAQRKITIPFIKDTLAHTPIVANVQGVAD